MIITFVKCIELIRGTLFNRDKTKFVLIEKYLGMKWRVCVEGIFLDREPQIELLIK